MKYVILDNIRSAYNVGAIFRTADGAGVDKVFLVGYTPTPIDRFGRVQSEISKTSLGASATVPWEYVETVPELLETLSHTPCTLVAVEQTEHSIALASLLPTSSVAYIFGNEVEGVSPALLAAADYCVELPMLGQKESLNVSVTAGIVLYRDLV